MPPSHHQAWAPAVRPSVRRGRPYLVIMGAVLVASAAVTVLAGLGVADELRPRPLTQEEKDDFIARDVAERWRTRRPEQIFPGEVAYKALGGVDLRARRVGIAPPSACRAGVHRELAGVLDAAGCRALLRVTYVDQSGTFAVTVGIAVFPDADARRRARVPAEIEEGVRPVAFPRTVAEGFGDAGRQRSEARAAGPYLVLATAGYTDGRTRAAMPEDHEPHSELWPTAQNISSQIAALLVRPPEVPRCTDGGRSC